MSYYLSDLPSKASGILISLLIIPMMSTLPLNTPSALPTVATVLVYGVPDEVVESFVGLEVNLIDIMSLDLSEGWILARDFLENLDGKRVDEGNAYSILIGCKRHDPEHPCQQDDILTKGGLNFPLEVVEVRLDIRLVFLRNGMVFSTHFGMNVPEYWQPDIMWVNGTGAVPFYGRIGRYALENGVMVENGHGGWVPAPITQNAKVRIHEKEYDVSMVFVYSFPFD